MELLADILFEVYLELMFLIVPEKKLDKKYVVMTKIIAIFVLLGMLALAFWGIVLIWDKGNLLGIIPLSIAIIISMVQIIAGVILFKRHH